MVRDNLPVNPASRILHKRTVVVRMIVRPQPGRPIACPACLQACFVELTDLLGIYNVAVISAISTHIILVFPISIRLTLSSECNVCVLV